MKRRHFLRTGLVAGLVLGASPSSLFAQTRQSTIFTLPPATTHIRHGLLQSSLAKRALHPSCLWIQQFERNIFWQTGLDQNEEKLIHYSFVIEEQLYGLGIQNDIAYINSSSEKTRAYKLDSQKAIKIELAAGFQLQIINAKNQIESIKKEKFANYFLCPIEGQCQLDGRVLNKQKASLGQGFLDLSMEENSILLLISNNA